MYSILKVEAGDFQPLVERVGSDVVRQENATNQIHVVCDGSTLTLRVNGQQLTTAEDDSFSEGDVALAATSYEDEPTEIHFDNLVPRESWGPLGEGRSLGTEVTKPPVAD